MAVSAVIRSLKLVMSVLDWVMDSWPLPRSRQLGDGQLALAALAPVVDRVRNHVDGLGQHVRSRYGLQVFPEHALREGQAIGVPERLAEQLVPHRDVPEQLRRPADMGADVPALDGARVQRRLGDAGRADPLDVAGDEI